MMATGSHRQNTRTSLIKDDLPLFNYLKCRLSRRFCRHVIRITTRWRRTDRGLEEQLRAYQRHHHQRRNVVEHYRCLQAASRGLSAAGGVDDCRGPPPCRGSRSRLSLPTLPPRQLPPRTCLTNPNLKKLFPTRATVTTATITSRNIKTLLLTCILIIITQVTTKMKCNHSLMKLLMLLRLQLLKKPRGLIRTMRRSLVIQ
ncbi:uncharacterized protein LOC114248280 [Bombyx mandarina]|uniref:Uncharacterized protein LOC114248280 n=1 Tax=Bombyx mandarina TaxID=7092 RepID=A0A6J2KAD7_BOMMA|nr:uncharacterized protein LOC114248280 [Bombyx mandarina]